MLAHHELCIDDMIDVYSDSVSDEEYLNIDVLVDKIVLHSDYAFTHKCSWCGVLRISNLLRFLFEIKTRFKW